MNNLKESRKLLACALQAVLTKKQYRKKRFSERQEELVKICRKCPGRTNGPWYCEDCTTGIRLHNLDAEYADVNNWWRLNI